MRSDVPTRNACSELQFYEQQSFPGIAKGRGEHYNELETEGSNSVGMAMGRLIKEERLWTAQ